MQLKGLFVVHLSKDKSKDLKPDLKSFPKVFYLETCQRWIWIFNVAVQPNLLFELEGAEVYRGRDAYVFLLKLATGLESKVLGETDIFGQLKTAWYHPENTQKCRNSDLAPWIQRIFEDTKEIRTQFLQNLGGSSYGSLVRKFIRERIGESAGPILLIGAGQLAQSIFPFLVDSGLLLWNRDPAHLRQFYEDLSKTRSAMMPVMLEEEEQGWAQATHVVICVPLDLERDSLRQKWATLHKLRSVIHLGGLHVQCEDLNSPWKKLPQFYSLSDLFAFQQSLGNVRSAQIARAHRACEERAKLRGLGSSLSICHGWEDLASFA